MQPLTRQLIFFLWYVACLMSVIPVSVLMQRSRIDGKSWLHFVSRGYGSNVESKEDGRQIDEFGSELLNAVTGTRRMMLKISLASEPGQATLQLAGRLGGEWVSELKRACGIARSEHRRVILDFADVVFVDRIGAALIRGLLREGISAINCSPFITEQLKESLQEKNPDHNES